jgi:hypothetical protein
MESNRSGYGSTSWTSRPASPWQRLRRLAETFDDAIELFVLKEWAR